jgi:hypothetical protein
MARPSYPSKINRNQLILSGLINKGQATIEGIVNAEIDLTV